MNTEAPTITVVAGLVASVLLVGVAAAVSLWRGLDLHGQILRWQEHGGDPIPPPPAADG